MDNNKKVVAVSGYFNPVHSGHLDLFFAAKALGDELVVILNSDEQVKLKGSSPFMDEQERARIVLALKPVDRVFLSIDKDKTVCESLKAARPDIFANGGDRKGENDIPELAVCRELGIEMIFNVGGDKTQSSSWLINKVKNA